MAGRRRHRGRPSPRCARARFIVGPGTPRAPPLVPGPACRPGARFPDFPDRGPAPAARRKEGTMEVLYSRCAGLDVHEDAGTGRIVASALTGHDADDGAQVDPLLDQVEGPVASLTGDGAYDRAGVYASVAERHPEAAVVVPPRRGAVPSEMAATAPTQRDRHIQVIAEHGRTGWQKRSGYNRRSRAEAAVARWKRVIGDGLRSRADERRATEVAVAAHVLDRMLELGRPSYARIA